MELRLLIFAFGLPPILDAVETLLRESARLGRNAGDPKSSDHTAKVKPFCADKPARGDFRRAVSPRSRINFFASRRNPFAPYNEQGTIRYEHRNFRYQLFQRL
jgi:hypothetical protein